MNASILLVPALLLLALPAPGQAAKPTPQHPFSTTPLAAGLQYSDALTVRAPKDFFRGWPSRSENGLVHAVVEIPAGACDKWEVKLDGVMRWDMKDEKPRHVKYLGYPANYGMVPRALLGKDIGGDGDPLDVIVLGPALPRGTVAPVMVLGTIRLIDSGDKDDKIIAVSPDSPMAACKDIADLDKSFPGVTAVLALWFENYKGAGALQCQGFGSAAEAKELLAAAEKSFAAFEAVPTTPDAKSAANPQRGQKGGSLR
ncbi:MAG: inorganic diphosphatase [Planctomycetota bacterium]